MMLTRTNGHEETRQDACEFPPLRPGAVVRVDTYRDQHILVDAVVRHAAPRWLVLEGHTPLAVDDVMELTYKASDERR